MCVDFYIKIYTSKNLKIINIKNKNPLIYLYLVSFPSFSQSFWRYV